ncbi:MAG: AMP-binding protein [Gammaproteobacteria bacterium]
MLLKGFMAEAVRHPDRTAFIEGERRVSYAQALHHTQQLAALINGPRAAIALDRGIDAALAILATLLAGAAYVPLDMKNPSQRLQFILADADVQCVIGQGPCPAWLPQSAVWVDIFSFPPPCLSASTHRMRAIQGNNESSEENIAAILYTSGSTGTPKGVALSHRALQHFVSWALGTFALSSEDRIASLAPFYFDLSVFDLFAGLTAGTSIYFVPDGLTLSPAKLTRWLSEHAISIWYTVPSLLSFIALKGALHMTPLPALQRILFAGEVFPTPQLRSICEQLPNVSFYNLFGPTETNVCCYWPVDRQRLNPAQPIPIGLSACDAELYIDPDSGELLVESQNNFSGYWRQGALVAPSDHRHRTGDKVSRNTRGELLYHGRLDRMLKCSGYRVEPAEIEAAINVLPDVERCAVFGITDAASGQRPAAALVLQPGACIANVAQALRERLPAYMQPYKYLHVDSLPYLSNGKIDYVSLQQQLS